MWELGSCGRVMWEEPVSLDTAALARVLSPHGMLPYATGITPPARQRCNNYFTPLPAQFPLPLLQKNLCHPCLPHVNTIPPSRQLRHAVAMTHVEEGHQVSSFHTRTCELSPQYSCPVLPPWRGGSISLLRTCVP